MLVLPFDDNDIDSVFFSFIQNKKINRNASVEPDRVVDIECESATKNKGKRKSQTELSDRD